MKVVIYKDDGTEVASGYWVWIDQTWGTFGAFASCSGHAHETPEWAMNDRTDDPWVSLHQALSQALDETE